MQSVQKTNNTTAFAFVVSVFFFWGFVSASNDILIPVFKKSLGLQNWQSQLINFGFYMAYTIGAIIYQAHAYWSKKDIIGRIGYEKSISLGLLISALGTLLFIPAAEYNSFGLMIFGLFVVGLGFSLQQTAANPFAIALGDPSKGSQRLSLAGGINNIGGIIGPLLITFAFVGVLATDQEKVSSIDDVKVPYLILGVAFFVAALIFFFLGKKNKTIPGLKQEINKEETTKEDNPLFSYPQLFFGMFAIFFYVGVEVATAGHIGSYMEEEVKGFENIEIAPYISLYWASIMIGRWVSAAAVIAKTEQMRLLFKVILPYGAFGLFLGVTFIAGYDVKPFLGYVFVIPLVIIADILSKEDPAKQLLLFSILGALALIIGMSTNGNISLFAFLSVGLFCSTLWPCIYTLATKNLGDQTAKGSSWLIMMIMGGAILSLLQGFLADLPSVGLRWSFIVGVACFAYLIFYALKMKSYFKFLVK